MFFELDLFSFVCFVVGGFAFSICGIHGVCIDLLDFLLETNRLFTESGIFFSEALHVLTD